MKLTPKQERFVAEYLLDLNATQAAIRAGYSEKTAQEQGSRLLSNVMVAEAVSKAQSRIADKAEWSAADRLSSLKAIHDAVKEDDARAAIAAIAEANKMQGSYAPAKVDHTSTDGSMTPKPTVIRIIAADDGSNDTATAKAGSGIQQT